MKGHSMRSGRSRCTSKIGPHQRSHKAASILRRQAIREGEGETMPMPNLRRGVDPVAHDLPKSVTEPVVTWYRSGTKSVEVFDFSGGVS